MEALLTLFIISVGVSVIHPIVYAICDWQERRIDHRWNHGASE